MNTIKKFFFEILIISVFSAIFSMLFNFINPKGIPIIARYPYEIYTDCAEFKEEAEFISINRVFNKLEDEDTLFIDSRGEEEYKKEHIKGAINIPYDVLFPVNEQSVLKIKDKKLVIFYDDMPKGSEYRPSKELASELKSRGVKSAKFLKESFSEWKKRGFPVNK